MPLIKLKQIEPFSLPGGAEATYIDHGLQPGDGGAVNSIAISQDVTAGGYLTLTSTPYTIPGGTKRRIQFYSTKNNSTRTYIVNGQLNGSPVSDSVSGPPTVSTPTETTQLFDQVDSIQVTGADADDIEVGHITGMYEIDLSLGDIHYISQDESMLVHTTNLPAAGTVHQIRLIIKYTGPYRIAPLSLFLGEIGPDAHGPWTFYPDPGNDKYIDLLVLFFGSSFTLIQEVNGNDVYQHMTK